MVVEFRLQLFLGADAVLQLLLGVAHPLRFGGGVLLQAEHGTFHSGTGSRECGLGQRDDGDDSVKVFNLVAYVLEAGIGENAVRNHHGEVAAFGQVIPTLLDEENFRVLAGALRSFALGVEPIHIAGRETVLVHVGLLGLLHG